MRRIFAKLHLWLSVPLGLIISVVCLSGAALVFEQDIIRALHPAIYRVQVPNENSQPLRPSEIAMQIQAQMPDTLRLSSLLIPSDPEEAWMAGFENVRRQTLSINPYTGKVNGWTESSPFFQTVRKLHRWLMDAPPQKGMSSAGKTIVGYTTLLMVIILLTGLFLWIPRTKRALKNRLQVSCTKGWRRFCYDSHVALGFYATVFLLVMALTGLTWSFGWYRTAAYSLFGGTSPVASQKQAGHGSSDSRTASRDDARNGKRQHRKGNADDSGRHRPEEEAFDFSVWDRAYAAALTIYPEHKSVTLGKGSMEVAPDPSSSLRKTDKLSFDSRTGKVTDISRYQDSPASQTLKGWFYAFHTGSWGGMWTKVLYFLAALIGGLLPLSGYYLWYKRTRAKRNKTKKKAR